jgi:hypothetical protein
MADTDPLFSGLSALVGGPVDLSQGAVRLNIGDFGPWWLELDPSGAMLTVHHTVTRFEAEDAAHWLALNTDLRRLGGAWLGLHTPTSTVRLLLLLELGRFDGTDLVNVITNLLAIRADLPAPPARQAASASDEQSFVAV